MATLDSSIVNVALPTLTKDWGVELSLSKWVVIVYLLVISCLLLPFGKISDLYGRRKFFTIGMGIFTVGSLFCGFSTTLGLLVFSRVIQAIGAAMLMANGPAIITAAFPGNELGKALGTMAMVVSLGLVSGPSIGGFLISHSGWKSIFLINIPIGIFGTYLAYRFVIKDRGNVSARNKPFDWLGTFLQIIIVCMLTVLFDPPQVAVSGGNPLGFSRILSIILIFVFIAVFTKIETIAPEPLLDLSLLKNRNFWTGNLAGFFNFISYSSIIVLMPFYLEEIMGFSTNKAGLFMTVVPMTIFVVAPISGRLSDHFGSLELSIAGALVGAMTLFVVSGVFGAGLKEGASSAAIVTVLACIGLSMGLFQSPNNNAIMSTVPPLKLGVASAMLATVRNLGMVTGTGLSTSVFAIRMENKNDFISAMHWSCFVGGIIGAGALITTLGKKRNVSRKT